MGVLPLLYNHTPTHTQISLIFFAHRLVGQSYTDSHSFMYGKSRDVHYKLILSHLGKKGRNVLLCVLYCTGITKL